MTVNIELARQTTELFLLIGEVHRLCNDAKSFGLRFKRGHKLFLKTCKGLQSNCYACVANRNAVEPITTVLNYAIALQADLNISLDHSVLYIKISSDQIEKICAFADSLGISYDI